MSEPVVSAARTKASWPCGLGLAGSAESSWEVSQEWVNSGGNVSASTGLALSTSASGIGRREVHGVPFTVGARGVVVEAMRESTGATDSGSTEGALAAMSTAFLAQQIPPLQKFDGATMSAGTELITEWLEQFELAAEVCRWDNSTKLVNLVTRLDGEAYSFYKSCTPQQRGCYSAMVSALTKRFTPVQIQAVQTSLFHERRQGERETVDSYAEGLRGLFHKAYPSALQGSVEAESMGRAVLASQFVSGLRPEIKAKIAGTEGSMDALLTKARFEEAKIRDLASNQQQRQKSFRSGFSGPSQHDKAAKPSEHQKAGTSEKSTVRCYGCGANGQYRNKCPVRDRGGPAESPGQRSTKVHVVNVASESKNHGHQQTMTSVIL